MLVYSEKIRVRYGETDQMGYVYYGNYALYYEQARTEMMRVLGFPYAVMEQQGIMLPVRNFSVTYYHSASYDELLTVKVSVEKMPTAALEIKYQTYNEAGLLLNEGTTTLVFVNAATRRPCRPPQAFLDALQNNASSNE
ncbi:thioesterase [Bacteroidia bacterium]|nr:thioesterase [Bacteroidia bacterium]